MVPGPVSVLPVSISVMFNMVSVGVPVTGSATLTTGPPSLEPVGCVSHKNCAADYTTLHENSCCSGVGGDTTSIVATISDNINTDDVDV